MFFSVIRSHSGCNDNPTAQQFKNAYKKTTTHIELSTTNTGNCIPIEETAILHVTSAPINVLNKDTAC